MYKGTNNMFFKDRTLCIVNELDILLQEKNEKRPMELL